MGIPTNKDSLTSQDANLEKRLKDTQKAYTQSRQEIARLKAELEASKNVNAIPDADTLARLDSLKFSDPDAWYQEKLKFDKQVTDSKNSFIQEYTQKELKEFESTNRANALNEFNSIHQVNLTEDILLNEVPNRIHNKLAAGTITYDEYLLECTEYLKMPKIIGDGNDVLGQPNLSTVGGSTTPADVAAKTDIVNTYNKIVW